MNEPIVEREPRICKPEHLLNPPECLFTPHSAKRNAPLQCPNPAQMHTQSAFPPQLKLDLISALFMIA